MKNQYFGDIRDLFKYDLIQHVMAESKILERCLWVPMLTEKDTSGDGEKVKDPRAGYLNLELKSFLENYRKRKKRDERNIADLRDVRFFGGRQFIIFSRGRRKKKLDPDYFDVSMNQYHKDVIESLQPKTLIFFDPDTGIEVSEKTMRRSGRERYFLKSEVNRSYNNMRRQSVLMIYQHHHRNQRQKFFDDISEKIKQDTALQPLYISDNDIAFFFLTKDHLLQQELGQFLQRYADEYRILIKK